MTKDIYIYFKDELGLKVSNVIINEKSISFSVNDEKLFLSLDNLKLRNNTLQIRFSDGTEASSKTRQKVWDKIIIRKHPWSHSAKSLTIGAIFFTFWCADL